MKTINAIQKMRKNTARAIALALVCIFAQAKPADCAISAEETQGAYSDSFNYEKSQEYKRAIVALSPIIAEYPDAYTPNLRLGWLNYLRGKYDDSEKYYRNAISAAPDSIEAKLGCALPLLAAEKYDEAVDALNDVIKADALNYTANLRFAFALRMLKKHDDAISVSNKFLALYPTDVSFMIELALAYYAGGDTESATSVMWGAFVLSPDNATAKEYFGK